jgi:DNA-binding MarR family transcriptional regulator
VSSAVAEIAADLHSIAIALLRNARREDLRLGLTSARLSALSVLAFGGDATHGELAAAEQVSLPTMTRIAAALVRAGLVRRCVDSSDRRYVRLQITRAGRILMQRGRTQRAARLASLLQGLGDDDVAAFRHVLAILREAL